MCQCSTNNKKQQHKQVDHECARYYSQPSLGWVLVLIRAAGTILTLTPPPPHLLLVLLYTTLHYTTLQYNTIHYNTIQYITLHYIAIQYNAIQYNTIQRLLKPQNQCFPYEYQYNLASLKGGGARAMSLAGRCAPEWPPCAPAPPEASAPWGFAFRPRRSPRNWSFHCNVRRSPRHWSFYCNGLYRSPRH